MAGPTPTPTSLEDLSVDQLLAHAKNMLPQVRALEQLAANPETREGLQRLLKKANPSLVIPEIDAKDAVMGEVSKLGKTVEQLQAQLLEREVRERMERNRANARRDYNLTEAELGEVEKLMVDKDNPIPSYDAAARVYKASRQSATPTPASFAPPTFQMPEREVWAKGIGNKAALDRIAMEQAYQAWGELRSGKVAGAQA